MFPKILDVVGVLLNTKLDDLYNSFLLLKIEPIVLFRQLFREILYIVLTQLLFEQILQVHTVLVDGVEF